jgi:hypothetical protein
MSQSISYPGLRSPRVVVSLLVLCVARPSAAQSAGDEPRFVGIRVGFGDLYKVGHWTPVELAIRGGREPITGHVTLTVADGDGLRSTAVSDRPYQVLPGETARVLMYVKPGRPEGEFTARLYRGPVENDDIVAQERFATQYDPDPLHPRTALTASQELIVGLGPSIGIEPALATRNANQQPEYETRYATVHRVTALPTHWYGYEGVNCLVLSTTDADLYSGLTESSAQLRALKDWVRLGGKLMLCVGSRAPQLLADGAPLAAFAPGRFAGIKTIRPGRAFESYISASEPLPELPRTAAGGGLGAAQLADVRGRVEVQEGGDMPLVVRAPFGFGEVVFVGVDLDQPPFSRWSQRNRLIDRLLDMPDADAARNQPPQHLLGFNDLSGQLRAGLDQFTGVKIAPFWLVVLLILVYIALIGPIDYVLVKKVLKRMELTWFTFPTIVVLVTAGAYFMAYWMKGDALLVNQVDVVDVDLSRPQTTALVRGTSWINIFSPQMQSYDVTVAPNIAQLSHAQRLVSWMGLPGTGFGGMNQTAAEPPLFSRPYWYTPGLDEMLRVPIQVWSTKSFSARWHGNSAEAAKMVDADLTAGVGDALSGRLVSRLRIPLTGGLLAYRGAVYPVGRLAPGEEFQVDPGSRRRLTAELVQRRGGPSVPDLPATPPIVWNPSSRDVPVVVEQMMFYEAAGGFGGTNLDNRYQQFIDLSGHLRMDQAILIGRSDQAAAPPRLDGRPVPNEHNRQWTFYRFLLAVKQPAKEK